MRPFRTSSSKKEDKKRNPWYLIINAARKVQIISSKDSEEAQIYEQEWQWLFSPELKGEEKFPKGRRKKLIFHMEGRLKSKVTKMRVVTSSVRKQGFFQGRGDHKGELGRRGLNGSQGEWILLGRWWRWWEICIEGWRSHNGSPGKLIF